MPDPIQNFFKIAGSHIVVALVTVLVTVSLALGSYRTKIDNLALEATQTREAFKQLSIDMNNLRVEVAGLKVEMQISRIQNK